MSPRVCRQAALLIVVLVSAGGNSMVTAGLADGLLQADLAPIGPAADTAAFPLMAAVTATLARQPNIQLQEQAVQRQQGILGQTRGQFDVLLSSSLNRQVSNTPLFQPLNQPYYSITSQFLRQSTYSASANVQFRSGVSFGSNLQFGNVYTNLYSYGSMPNLPASMANVGFTLAVPLLKNRGVEATGAQEMSAGLDLEATRLDLLHTVSASVTQTTQAYWQYVLQRNRLQVLSAAEERARMLLDDVGQLVAGKLRPAGDLEQLRGNLQERIAQRLAAEQTLLEAGKTLGVAMGLQGAEILTLPLPSDGFPDVTDPALAAFGDRRSSYQELAVAGRNDLAALRKREQSAEVQLVAAQKNLLPNLDFSANVSYNGLSPQNAAMEGWVPINGSWRGLNYNVGITFAYPLGNSAAEGNEQQKRADRSQARIRTVDLERQIVASVGVATAAVQRYAAALGRTRQSVTAYVTAVDNEMLKYSAGMTTVIDVINTQDRLTGAQLNLASNHQQLASAILQLRYETATILTRDHDNVNLEWRRLVTVPAAEPRR